MNINMEYRKGIIFLRPKGYLTKETYKKLENKINRIVDYGEFTNIVLNLSRLTRLDLKGISSLFYTYDVIKKYKGNIYICINNEKIKEKLKKHRLLNYIEEIDSELDAFKLIRI